VARHSNGDSEDDLGFTAEAGIGEKESDGGDVVVEESSGAEINNSSGSALEARRRARRRRWHTGFLAHGGAAHLR
jgi:hypothetical protein